MFGCLQDAERRSAPHFLITRALLVDWTYRPGEWMKWSPRCLDVQQILPIRIITNIWRTAGLVDIHVDTGRKLKVLSNCKHSYFNVNFIGCDLRHCCRYSKVHPSQVLKITFELTCTHTCRHGRKLGLIIHQRILHYFVRSWRIFDAPQNSCSVSCIR